MVRRMSANVALVVAMLALLGVGLSCDSSGPAEAPDFSLPTMTGGNVTLSELRGIPVVLNFWSIGCSWCRYQLPFLEAVANQTGGALEVVAINMVDSAGSVESFFGEYEPAMIVALDEDAEVFVNYCQSFSNSRGSIPFTLFIDSEGLVQYVKVGAFTSEEALWNALHDVFGISIP